MSKKRNKSKKKSSTNVPMENKMITRTVETVQLKKGEFIDEENLTIEQSEQKALLDENYGYEFKFTAEDIIGKIEEKVSNLYANLKFFLKRFSFKDGAVFALLLFLIFKMNSIEAPKKEVKKYHPQNSTASHFKMDASNEDRETAKMRRDWRYIKETLNKKELIVTWFNEFVDVRYKRGGVTEKFNNADCVEAVYHVLRKYGYRGKTRNVQGTYAFCKKLNKAGLLDFRKRRLGYRDVKTGDMIMFKPNKSGIPHIGMVTEYRNGYICYVDMNGSVSMGLTERIRANNRRIWEIAEISWHFWSTDELERTERERILKNK